LHTFQVSRAKKNLVKMIASIHGNVVVKVSRMWHLGVSSIGGGR
jgi:hypothetical protein